MSEAGAPPAIHLVEESSPRPTDVAENVDHIIALTNVSRKYPPRQGASSVRALRKVTFRVRRGARVAIRGESGSGKTTLLNLLGGLDRATKGRVVVDRRNLGDLSERELARYRAQKIGFVFQTFNLLPELTAVENVEFPMDALGTPRAQQRARALELLGAVGMDHRADHRPDRMSGGEQQRVAIARALANKPALILADEPTGNLDRASRRMVIALLKRINEETKTTLVIVTHDPNVANQCEKVHVIKYGRLIREYVPQPSDQVEAEDDYEGEAGKRAVPDEDSDDDEPDDE
jgi:putative ABC transport system ATP-binding protein